jgi:signal transduction histidine kinase
MPDLKDRIHYVATLIDNLLHWAKDQMEGIQAKPGIFDLPQVIHETVNLLNPQAKKKSITLEVDATPSLQVYGDKDMIKLVLRNLISNAIKFTPQKGAIAITTRNENEYIYVAVTDTGTGLSPEEINRIQDKEYFTKYGTAGEKGSGLGLMLCREFIEKNGGQLFIESKPDIGSTFTFSLPLR